MKKILVLLTLVSVAFSGAFAQQSYMSLGLSFSSDTFNEDLGTAMRATNSSSIGVRVESFAGYPLGIYTAVSMGLPVSVIQKTGTMPAVPGDLSLYDMKTTLSALMGLGYTFNVGGVDVMAAIGGGYSALILMDGDYEYDPVMYMTVGPGAGLSVTYSFDEQYGVYFSVYGIYGIFQPVETSDYFENSLTLSPSAGLRIRLR